jgi:hypothetical protein
MLGDHPVEPEWSRSESHSVCPFEPDAPAQGRSCSAGMLCGRLGDRGALVNLPGSGVHRALALASRDVGDGPGRCRSERPTQDAARSLLSAGRRVGDCQRGGELLLAAWLRPTLLHADELQPDQPCQPSPMPGRGLHCTCCMASYRTHGDFGPRRRQACGDRT